MKIGAIFPQLEIGQDPGAIREYVQQIEDIGFDHIGIYDHVLGADTNYYRDWRGPYTSESMFHEPMVLYGYLSAVTTKLELVTEIIILPQRQTALLAKQAAEVDILSGGRLRLGIGIGWNHVEYEGLGQDFHIRGQRSEEQIRLLRELWTKEVITFDGRWDQVTAAGINPLPVQRPIPLWLGGGDERVLRRIARLGDGWFPQGSPDDPELQGRLERLRKYTEEAGRGADSIGIEGRISPGSGNPEEWAKIVAKWEELGATHISMPTDRAGFTSHEGHLDALRKFYEVAKR